MSKKVLGVSGVVFSLLAVTLYFVNSGEKGTEQQMEKAPATAVPVGSANSVFEDSNLGFTFSYPVGRDGYTLYETAPDAGAGTQLKTLMLVHENERAMIENPPAYSEGPINITVNVFENSLKQFPLSWAEANTQYSNIQMVTGEVSETVIGGANALRYKVDGLYAFDVVVVAHGSLIYVFSASYHDTNSPTYRDFGSVLESVRFIPELDQA
jgi:hypothetical protein